MSETNCDHPFLSPARPVHWDRLAAADLPGDIRQAIREAGERLGRIGEVPSGDVSYANTIEAMDEALSVLSDAWSLASHLNSVRTGPELREAFNQVLPEVSDFFNGICLRDSLWTRVRKVAENRPPPEEPVFRRHVEETRRDFEEAGANLDGAGKKRLLAIGAEMASLTQKFTENVLDSTEAWSKTVTDPALLEGLPASATEAARERARADADGAEDRPAWKFTLEAPSYLPVLQYAHSDGFRREVWEAASRIGADGEHGNAPLILRILGLRAEKAALLGFPDFADYATRRRMVGSGVEALGFVERLHDRICARFLEEVRELEEFRAAEAGDEVRRLEPWEVAYWSERLRRKLYDFDEEELREWFPIESVQRGLFVLAERVFDVRIVPADPGVSGGLWHPDVEFYELFDGSGHLLGAFYADWYPRKGKRDGAWMNPLFTGSPFSPTAPKPHYGVICGNLTPPSGKRPSLLTHREVETIFHEFGHLLHHLCSTVPVRGLSGTNVAWDFVELPSQIMENWCWERESLDLFALHHETGEPLPESLFNRMRKARNFQSAMHTMRQISFAKMDLELHRGRTFASPEEMFGFLDEVLADYRIPLSTKPPSMLPRFTHLFGSPTGYAAGYYSYKYSEMLDADAFSRFQSEGVLNGETGRDFRRKILARGNSEPPEVLFADFMGRDPDPEALLARAGLAG